MKIGAVYRARPGFGTGVSMRFESKTTPLTPEDAYQAHRSALDRTLRAVTGYLHLGEDGIRAREYPPGPEAAPPHYTLHHEDGHFSGVATAEGLRVHLRDGISAFVSQVLRCEGLNVKLGTKQSPLTHGCEMQMTDVSSHPVISETQAKSDQDAAHPALLKTFSN